MKRKVVKSIAYFIATILLLLSVSSCSKKSNTHSENSNLENANASSNYSTENVTKSQPEHLSEVPNGYIGIYTVEDLQNSTFNTEGNYILMNDLDLSSVADWEGINNKSTFDGNNYTISNLKSTKSGLFLEANSICNLNVRNIDININGAEYGNGQYWSIGGLVCTAYKVENCTTSGKLKITDTNTNWYIGGIIGQTPQGPIKNCSSSLEIIQTSPSNCWIDIGGICGSCSYGNVATIENCEFSGRISAENAQVGGICGNTFLIEVKIYNSINKGSITCNFSSVSRFADCMAVGGIMGYGGDKTTVENCSNIGKIFCNINSAKFH